MNFIKSLKIDGLIIILSIGVILYGVVSHFYFKPQIQQIIKESQSQTSEELQNKYFQEKLAELKTDNKYVFYGFGSIGIIFSIILPVYFFLKNKIAFTKKWVAITACILIYLLGLQPVLGVLCLFCYLYKIYLDFQGYRKKPA